MPDTRHAHDAQECVNRHGIRNGQRCRAGATKKGAEPDRPPTPAKGRTEQCWPAPLAGRGSVTASVLQEPRGLRLAVLAGQFLTLARHSDCQLPASMASNRLCVTSLCSRVGPPGVRTVAWAYARPTHPTNLTARQAVFHIPDNFSCESRKGLILQFGRVLRRPLGSVSNGVG